jgi:hypothetical protein
MCEWLHSIHRPVVYDCPVLLSGCGGESRNYFAVQLEDGVLWWSMDGITLSPSNGVTAKG